MRLGPAIAVAAALVGSACAGPPPASRSARQGPGAPPSGDASPPAAARDVPAEDEAAAGRVEAMLQRVAQARALPIRRRIRSRVLDRDAIVAQLRKKVEHEVPKEVVAGQGEALAALELVPADYDFVGGVFALLGGRIAGYYEPDDQTMYLVDDLSDSELEETLSHELVHALQDQSFALGAMLKYAPGDSDRIAAVHALIEGDAMAGMFEALWPGSGQQVSESGLRRLLNVSTAMSVAGSKAPRVLQSSLTAPYSDGYALVKQLRDKGGWKAVDNVWRNLPQTTEQLLHMDKLVRREPALVVPAIAVGALGAGWRVSLDDIMGEQGLRIVLEDWTSRDEAVAAAAGWGGDRYVIAERAAAGRREVAFAWHLRMDTTRDATELTRVFASRFGSPCHARPQLGPLLWKASGTDVVVVAGPYQRDGLAARGSGASCDVAAHWADALLHASSRPGAAPSAATAAGH